MLDKATEKKITEFIYAKPRTVQEIALLLKVNWRTADRYVNKIAAEQGTLACRTFREGTRGALKIVFWNPLERLAASEAQERLLRQIETSRQKEYFSFSEIFQFVPAKARKLKALNENAYSSKANFRDFANLLKSASSQILFFSGNLTWSNYPVHDKVLRQIVEEIGARGVASKILTRVELAGLRNVKDVLAINQRLGRDAVEMRHCYQPLRTTIVDDRIAISKDVLDPKSYEAGELKEKTYLMYYIYDPDWISWLQKVFWHLFRPAVDAKTRIAMLEHIRG